MRCEELQSDLALYLDGELSATDADMLDAHLEACPLCRQRLDETRALKMSLRSLARPRMPEHVMASVRQSIIEQADPSTMPFGIFGMRLRLPSFRLVATSYAVGSFGSLVFAAAFLWLIVLANTHAGPDLTASSTSSPVMMANAMPGLLTPREFASTRADISAVSPSLNPQGSLSEATLSLVNNEEVVVVADVYENGSAEIAQVVASPKDQKAVTELAKALEQQNLPFVPADLDQRSDTMRVVLRIQSVDVNTRPAIKKGTPKKIG